MDIWAVRSGLIGCCDDTVFEFDAHLGEIRVETDALQVKPTRVYALGVVNQINAFHIVSWEPRIVELGHLGLFCVAAVADWGFDHSLYGIFAAAVLVFEQTSGHGVFAAVVLECAETAIAGHVHVGEVDDGELELVFGEVLPTRVESVKVEHRALDLLAIVFYEVDQECDQVDHHEDVGGQSD